ncbi:MAG: transglutaminase N-terminal domain-containing protein [Candidatus Competibacterales bacterium]
MKLRYRITHRTSYGYDEDVMLCHNQAYLLPRHTPRQRSLSSQLLVTPTPSDAVERMDFYGNRCHHFTLQTPHRQLEVVATSELEVQPLEGVQGSPHAWETVAALLADDLSPCGLEARDFTLPSPMVEPTAAVRDYAQASFPPQRPLFDAVMDLTQRIYRDFTYDAQATTVVTPLSQVLEQRRGVCQDFAHLAIAGLRSLGLPARYVSGYLETLPPPGTPKLRGADASHAWFSVYSLELGWLDFDPTNGQVPDAHYLTTAWGRDYSDVPPLKGIIFGGGGHTLQVGVDVERVSPSVDLD